MEGMIEERANERVNAAAGSAAKWPVCLFINTFVNFFLLWFSRREQSRLLLLLIQRGIDS
jgi:hypothetical protein